MEEGEAAGAQFTTINSDHFGFGSMALSALTPELEEAMEQCHDDEAEEILGEQIAEKFQSVFKSFHHEFQAQRSCVYCRLPILKAYTRSERSSWPEYWIALKWCENCRAWALRSSCIEAPSFKFWYNTALMSKARNFPAALPRPCAEEIGQFLRRHPGYFHNIDPRLLERFVADVFKANYRQSEVLHVGRSGDWGVDVIFVDSTNTDWLIQVKRRGRPHSTEPFSTVQSLAGALILHGKLNGIVVSTADHFSAQAYQAVKRLEKQRYRVRLYDRGILNRMISPVLPTRPWSSALQKFCWGGLHGKPIGVAEIEEKVIELRKKTQPRARTAKSTTTMHHNPLAKRVTIPTRNSPRGKIVDTFLVP
jgi:hypothetical protein